MIDAEQLKRGLEYSPAFVLDMDQVQSNLQPLQRIRRATACKVLYSMKALPLGNVLAELKAHVDGISVSSLFEARLAKDILAAKGGIHVTTPGLRPDEFAEMSGLCSHISFNSLAQYRHMRDLSEGGYSAGLRVNPKLSFAADVRYDPCRLHSKLGVDIEDLQKEMPTNIEGLHVHTVFSQTDFVPLQAVIRQLKPILQRYGRLKWLNLGGGYLYHSIADLNPLIQSIDYLKTQYADDVVLEPGKALVGNAGYLLTSVLDSFQSDGKTVLVLDTSVNHHPEVFEYQRKPKLLEEDAQGANTAILAGCTCLAGDLFGEYRFNALPKVGDRLVFADVGAYSLIKANRFNGYALPSVYVWRNDAVNLVKQDDFDDYRRQWFA